ncbi:hybrid sensor histidine kinase/response regulator [Pseudodesulfovibrio sp.]|uniref:hybrid sensor histidine kinase/response regulator n=1 Tax=unclassified Pseudodesulfovibrio TaxID=2661612 RepID=UPI003AFFB9B4
MGCELDEAELDRILIVEDSRSIAQELQRSIGAAFSLSVEVASDYAQAEEMLGGFGSFPFLAILDLTLADAPNGEIVDLFRNKNIPSIIFSSDFSEETRARMFAKGIIDYVVKDGQAVSNVLDYIRRLRRNRGIRVLVVDDSASSRALQCSLLRRQMFLVDEAASGTEALEILRGEEEISLAIVDYMMGDMDGVALIRSIRGEFGREKLPVIGVSSSKDPMLTVRFLKHGASDFLAKPFEAEEFNCRVDNAVEMVEAVRQLTWANRIKNQLLGTAVHDLRSPISGIKGFSEMLLDNVYGELAGEQREVIEFIHSANSQMDTLVNDLLDISSIGAGQLRLNRRLGSLVDVANKAIHFHSLAAKAKSITILPLEGEAPPFGFDAQRIGQVLDNLLSNAIKFSQVGTTIRVTLEVVDGQARVSVLDQGQGIPEDELEELFQSYHRTSVRPTAGEASTGLGLVIAKKIVEVHGGTIGVESEPGHGSTFHFSLPMN